jgi:hypothetical protein
MVRSPTMKPMFKRCLYRILGCLLAAVSSSAAQENSTTIRSYDHKVQMHEAPVGDASAPDTPSVAPPSRSKETRPSLNSSKWLETSPSFNPIIPYRVITITPDKQDKNWLLPSQPDKEKKQEAKPSGWGWLADNIKQIQQEREQAKPVDENDEGNPLLLNDDNDNYSLPGNPAKSQPQNKTQPKSDLARTPFKPVQTEHLISSSLENSPDDLLAGRESVKDQVLSPTLTADENNPNRNSISLIQTPKTELLDRKSGMDEAWGLERTRTLQPEAQERGLTQTATILKDITASSKGMTTLPGASSLLSPKALEPSGFKPTDNAKSSLTKPSSWAGSESSLFKNQGSLFKPVSSDLGGNSFMNALKPTLAPLPSLTPLPSQSGGFNSLQQPPKDFWKKPDSYR